MKSIVEGLELVKSIDKDFPDSYKDALKDAGFKLPVTHYPVITVTAINNFLQKRLREKYQRHPWSLKSPAQILDFDVFSERIVITYRVHGDRRAIAWNEGWLRDCEMTPPLHVLSSIKRAKPLFDSLRVVTISDNKVPDPDPLIIGMRSGDSRRYLIDWWDKDIDPTDLVDIPSKL